MPKHDDDQLTMSFLVVRRPGGDPVVDLIMVGCLTCGASVYEIENQTGDLCPMCERDPAPC